MDEARTSFPCFGSRSSAIVVGDGAEAAVALVEASLRSCHERFSRFDPASELSRLNADPRATVAVSPMLARLAQAAVQMATLTGGLVDPTLVPELERAGYASDHRHGLPLELALAQAPPRRPARPRRERRWMDIAVDASAHTVSRPPGVALDSGGLKGLFADVVARHLSGADAYVVDCGGDLRLGGLAGEPRTVEVTSPFADGDVLHELAVAAGGVATSGIGRRSWLDRDGRPAHHVLDPSTGRPAYTGLVQVTALAPTALEAEARAKAALLSGPAGAARWLPHGGVLVTEDRRIRVLADAGASAGRDRTLERARRGPLQHRAVLREARPVTRAVP
jgi:FAD:protein FMN transferase